MPEVNFAGIAGLRLDPGITFSTLSIEAKMTSDFFNKKQIIDCEYALAVAKAELEEAIAVKDQWPRELTPNRTDIDVSRAQLKVDEADYQLKVSELDYKLKLAQRVAGYSVNNVPEPKTRETSPEPTMRETSPERRVVIQKAKREILKNVANIRKIVKDASVTYIGWDAEQVSYDGKVLTITV